MSTGCGNGWKMLLTCGPHINEKYARRRGKKENTVLRGWNTILSLDSKCVLLRCSLNKLNLQTNKAKWGNRKSI